MQVPFVARAHGTVAGRDLPAGRESETKGHLRHLTSERGSGGEDVHTPGEGLVVVEPAGQPAAVALLAASGAIDAAAAGAYLADPGLAVRGGDRRVGRLRVLLPE